MTAEKLKRRGIPDSAEFQTAPNSRRRRIPNGGTTNRDSGARWRCETAGVVEQLLAAGDELRAGARRCRRWSFRLLGFRGVWDSAPFGIPRRSGFRAVSAVRAVIGVLFASTAALAQSGGNGTIYVGTYAKKILVVNEANLKVVDSIPISVGIPTSMVLSSNRKHFYVLDPQFENVEVIDIATRKAIDKFTLSSGNTRVRLWGINVDPRERFAVVLVKTYTKLRDRFEVGKPTLLRYDLAKKAVTDTIPWPKGEERDGAQIIFSPDGELMYFFTTDDVLIYSTDSLKQVDRWELSRALFEEGFGRLNFFFPNDIYEDPGFYTGLFRTTDPVNRRTLMGVARVDLVKRSVDFYTLGPSEPVSFRLAPGRRRGYGLRQQVGNYEFWTFDLEGRRVAQRTKFAGRPRMGLTPSSNGRQLYIHTAGPTIDVYDTQSFRRLRTVDLGADMSGLVIIPPPAPAVRQGSSGGAR
jgi:DNA-binding beta-propeller fold protein YncE